MRKLEQREKRVGENKRMPGVRVSMYVLSYWACTRVESKYWL